MKILRTIGILAIVAGLVLGGTGSAFAKGPPDPHPGGGNNAHGKRGLFGTAESAGGDVVTLKTKEGSTVQVTLTDTAKYKAPGETKGWIIGVENFVNEVLDGDIENIVGRRIAALVSFTDVDTADALRLMLIKITPPLHAHRVGIVTEFTPYTPEEDGSDGSIVIMDNHGVSHTFDVTGDTVYRPEGTTSESIIPYEGCVTVVTKGDPKLSPSAKAIVLHEELPDWAGGRIIVQKRVDSGDPEQSFEFDPSWSDSNFSLSGGEQYKSGWLSPGEYDVEEFLPDGWDLPDIDIDDPDEESTFSDSTATIDLDLGETVTVTFTNQEE